jgi:hypothetical protein
VTSVTADALLPVENRPSEREHDGERDRDQDRGEEQDEEERGDTVQRVLQGVLEAPRARGHQLEQRQGADVRELHARGDALEEPRDDEGTHAEPFAFVQEPEEDVVRCGGEREHDAVDAVRRDDVLEVPARTEHGERQRAAVVDRVLVEEADGVEAELRGAREPARCEAADLAGADDEGAHPAELGPPPSMDDRDRRCVGHHQQRRREAPQAHRVVCARLVAEGERRDELRRHRGHGGGGHDQPGVVEHLEAEAVADRVDARRVEDDQGHDDERQEGGAREGIPAVERDRGDRRDDQRDEVERGAERSRTPLRGPRRAMPVPGRGSRCRLGERSEGPPTAGLRAGDGKWARSHGITEFDGE